MRLASVLAMIAWPGIALAELAVPSGQPLVLDDVILEPDSGIARFRFIAPRLGGQEQVLTYSEVADDFVELCVAYALPALLENDWQATEIIITLSAEKVAFGESRPDTIQLFEAFRIEGEACVWDQF